MFNIITGPIYIAENIHHLDWFEYITFFLALIFSYLACLAESEFIFLPVSSLILIYILGIYYGRVESISFDFVYLFSFILEYFIVGFSYSIFKWCIYCANKANYIKNNFDKLKVEYNLYKNTYISSIHYAKSFKEYLIEKEYIPSIKNNKYKIFYWTIWWPFDIVVFITKDLFVNIFDIFWKFSKKFFTSIQEKIFKIVGIDENKLSQ